MLWLRSSLSVLSFQQQPAVLSESRFIIKKKNGSMIHLWISFHISRTTSIDLSAIFIDLSIEYIHYHCLGSVSHVSYAHKGYIF